jgi:lysophospholipase L1-like esterase
MRGGLHAPRVLLGALIAALVLANPMAAAGVEGDGLDQIEAGLPTIADLPGVGLERRTVQPQVGTSARAPYPCAEPSARGMRPSTRWGEWAATGRGRAVRVLVFAYPEERTGAVWRALRTAIAACPSTTDVEEDDGTRGTATFITRRLGAATVRVEVLTRSASGSAAWSRDRVIIYQRVGDAIQKVQVARQIITDADRAAARRIARVSRAKYRQQSARPEADAGAAALIGDVDAPLLRALATLPPGAKLNVAIGDSMASGEAGRWRGNVFWQANWAQADAYGEAAYWDTPTGESVAGCHRAKGAEIHIPGTHGLNLACSGAKTTSEWSTELLSYGQYKPGLDDGAIRPGTSARAPGQLTLLSRVAQQASIGSIVVSIGGNDMGFGGVMTACVGAFLRPWPFELRCQDDAAVQRRLTSDALAAIGIKVEAAIVRTITTMQRAGYANGTWQLIVQNYPQLIAEDARYADTYLDRLYAGGCPIHSADVAWLNARVPMTAELRSAAARAAAATGQPVDFLDVSTIFSGRELCARDAAHVDGLSPQAVTARGERVQMVRGFAPFVPVEGFHPNQLGQQALQACVRAAISAGAGRSGRCQAPLDWSQVDDTGLPLVRFAVTS